MATKAKFDQEIEIYFQLRHAWRKDPRRYVRQRLGVNPTWQQDQILESICPPGSKVSVRSGHGIGKDATAAMIIWWFLETHDYSKCACTAPSSHQLRDILWSELSKWKRRSDSLSEANGFDTLFWLDNMFEINQDIVKDRNAPLEWFAIARTARKENPEALQGLHATDLTIDESGTKVESSGDTSLLFVIDEASGVDDVIFEVAEGALSSHDSRVLMIGNPTRNIGYFAASHKGRRSEYKTLHFRSDESPLVDPDYRPGLVRRFGENSNVVRVRADGEFPKQDDDTLIALEHAEAAISREWNSDERQPTGLKRLGIDVARQGSDRTTFVCRHDFLVTFIEVRNKQDTMQTVGQAIQFAERLQVDDIAVDEIGFGAGVVDRLREVMDERRQKKEWHCTVTGVNVAEAAPIKSQEEDEHGKIPVAQGAKLRDYLWIEAGEWLKNDHPCFVAPQREYCETLAGELSTPTFKLDSNGRIVVESKDDMKKRLGSSNQAGQSPDLADGLNVTFAPMELPPPIIAPPIVEQQSRWSL